MIDLTTVAAPNLPPALAALELPGPARQNLLHRADDLPHGRLARRGGRVHLPLLNS